MKKVFLLSALFGYSFCAYADSVTRAFEMNAVKQCGREVLLVKDVFMVAVGATVLPDENQRKVQLVIGNPQKCLVCLIRVSAKFKLKKEE